MSAKLQRERDDRGWRIPAPGTRAYEVYLAMQCGFKPGVIAEMLGASKAAVRVEIWRIRNPDRANATQWRAQQEQECV